MNERKGARKSELILVLHRGGGEKQEESKFVLSALSRLHIEMNPVPRSGAIIGSTSESAAHLLGERPRYMIRFNTAQHHSWKANLQKFPN